MFFEYIINMIKKFGPSILGILDEIFDIVYVITQEFAHEAIYETMIAFIVLAPVL